MKKFLLFSFVALSAGILVFGNLPYFPFETKTALASGGAPTIGINFSDQGCGNHRGTMQTAWYAPFGTNYISGWASDDNAFDPDCAQVSIDGRGTAYYGYDFRFKLMASDKTGNSAGCGDQLGGWQETGWASDGGGAAPWASDSNYFDPNCAKVAIETRDLPPGVTITDARLGIQASDHGCTAQFGDVRYTPWSSDGGGASDWATDSNSWDPDCYQLTLDTKVIKIGNIKVQFQASDGRQIGGAFKVKNSSSQQIVVDQAAALNSATFEGIPWGQYEIYDFPQTVQSGGTTYTLTGVTPGTSQLLGNGCGGSGQTSPYFSCQAGSCTANAGCGASNCTGCFDKPGPSHPRQPVFFINPIKNLIKTVFALVRDPVVGEPQGHFECSNSYCDFVNTGTSADDTCSSNADCGGTANPPPPPAPTAPPAPPEITFTLNYQASSAATLGCSLSATPSSGVGPLSTNLQTSVGGSAQGTINYWYWWNCARQGSNLASVISACGNPETDPNVGMKINASPDNPKSVTHSYLGNPLTYDPKVIVERQNLSAACNANVTARLVDLKVRGTNDSNPKNFALTDGPITATPGNRVDFVWQTNNVTNCRGQVGNPGGYPEWRTNKAIPNGNQAVQIFGGREFILACDYTSGGQTISVDDRVFVNTGNEVPNGQHLYNEGTDGLCRAVGYASDPNSPSTPVSVKIYVDGATTSTLTSVADQENAQGTCVDNSVTCGFFANLRGLISEGVQHLIRVKAVDNESATTTVDLANTPLPITCGGCTGSQCTPRCVADLSTGSNTTTTVIGRDVALNGVGGSGAISWSGGGTPASAGNVDTFVTKFNSTGVKTVTFTRGGVSSACTVNVTNEGPPPPPPGSFTCLAFPQNPSVGEETTVTANGGTGPYKWLARGSSACTTQCAPTNSPLVISYATPGVKTVTSTDSASPAKNTNCNINVGACTNGTVNVISNLPTTWTLSTPNGPVSQSTPASDATYTNQPNGSYQLVNVPDIAGYTKTISPAGAQSLVSCGESIGFVINYTQVQSTSDIFWITPPSDEVEVGRDAPFSATYDPDGNGPMQRQGVTEASTWSSNSSHAAFKSVSFLYGALFTGVSVGPATITAKYTPPGRPQLTATAALNVVERRNPPPPSGPSWSCSITPNTRNASPGDTVTYAVTADASEPFAEPINLSAVGLPADIAWSFSPASIHLGETSVLTLGVGDTAQNGTKPFSARCVIQGTSNTEFADADIVVSGAEQHLGCYPGTNTCGWIPGNGNNEDGCVAPGNACNPSACDLTARPSVIYQNGSSQLQWTCGGGITSCSLATASGDPVTSGGASGEFTVSPQTTTKYNLSCNSGAATDSVTVRVFKLRETPPQ